MNKKNNKLVSIIFIALFIIISAITNWEDYIKNLEQNKELKNQIFDVKDWITNYKIENIKEIDDIQLNYTPDKLFLEELAKKIENSKEKVYIEVYMFTEKRIKSAVKKAFQNGVEVKILLEKDPYMAYSINDNFYNEFVKESINVKWSDTKDYALNHSKFMIIDDLAIISTGNLTYSTFTKNRDFFVITKDKKIVSDLIKLFNYDYSWEKIDIYSDELVLSPTYSRLKLEDMIEKAQKEIKIYIQYVNDNKMAQKIIDKFEKNDIDIKIILAETAKNDENTKKMIEKWINISFMKNPKMHSKAILIDNKYLFLGSVNFSSYSLDRNREVWLIIKNQKIIDEFTDIFTSDFIK